MSGSLSTTKDVAQRRQVFQVERRQLYYPRSMGGGILISWLLAGLGPISPMKAKITISPISNKVMERNVHEEWC